MNKKTHILLVCIALGLVISCEKELSLDIPEYKQQVVVEGAVEPGERTRVLLSLTAPFFNEYDSVSMMDYRLTTAKVALKYDTVYEILRLKRNDEYFPPFVYESQSRGKIHKNYQIEVINQGDTTRGSTIIPDPVPIDSLWYVQKEGSDSLYYFQIRFSDDPATNDHYVIFTKINGEEDQFYPARTIAYDDAFFNGEQVTFRLERGMSSVLDVQDSLSYRLGDEVFVKLSTVSKEVYEYWNSYQNILFSSANPFSSPSNTLQSNIENGTGIFGGYGAYIDTIKIKKGD